MTFKIAKNFGENTQSKDQPLPLERRTELCATRVTLDGKPAVISARLMRFAKVSQLNSSLSCEFAWETVDRVVLKGGNFKS